MKAKLLRIADKYVSFPIYLFSSLIVRFLSSKKGGRKVLGIKLWALGETVTIMPALKALKERGYKIHVLATPANKSILEGSDFIDELIIMEINPLSILRTMNYLRKKRFQYAIDFEPYTKFSAVISCLTLADKRIGFSNRKLLYTDSIEFNENSHAVENFINLVNIIEKIDYPEGLVKIHLNPDDRKFAENEVKKMKKFIVGIHAGSAGSSISRRWPEEKFAELCDRIIEKYNADIVLFGTEKEINNKIISLMKNKPMDMAGKLSLKRSIALMEKMDLFICNDSGPMHMSAAMGTTTIGLFGPNSPERYGPYGKKNLAVYKKPECSPCIIVPKGKFPECENPICMKEITVNDVMEAVARSIKIRGFKPGCV